MKRLRDKSGQMFILAGLIALLLLATIPMIVFLTRTYAIHQMGQLKKSQALSVAETGISWASHELNGSKTPTFKTWANALNNTFGATVGSPDCPAGTVTIPGVAGSVKLTCIAPTIPPPALAPDLEPYQVAVIATAHMPSGDNAPTRTMEAYLSKRTLGITLPDGTQAGAALQLARVPTSAPAGPPTPQAPLALNALIVHWGPIACYHLAPRPNALVAPPVVVGPTVDPIAWTLADPLDKTPLSTCPDPAGGAAILCPGFPRKFSNGGLTGSAPTTTLSVRRVDNLTGATTTDNSEWWAYASLQVPPQLDLTVLDDPVGSYQKLAENQTAAPLLVGLPNCPNTRLGNHITATAATCSLLGATNMSLPTAGFPTGTVLFIDGATGNDAVITNQEITVGALIVTNNLSINAPFTAATAGSLHTLQVPTSAYKEYLGVTSAQTSSTYNWPCGNSTTTPTPAGTTCTSATAGPGNINFTGFLYVAGNMTVNTPWVMNGALAVGDVSRQYVVNDIPPTGTGQLIIPAAGQLTLFYDATIAHNILVLNNELQIDRIQETSPQ